MSETALPAQKWGHTNHSGARAIAAAVRLLGADSLESASVSQADLACICSELVYRATGERLYPSWAPESAAADGFVSTIRWVPHERETPPMNQEVLVFIPGLATRPVTVAVYTDRMWGDSVGPQYFCNGGRHPGVDYENPFDEPSEVAFWAPFPRNIARSRA